MTDKQWIRAMQKYGAKDREHTFESWRKGGCNELAGALRADAAKQKSRFAQLCEKMPVTLPPVFFSRLLDGLVDTDDEQQGDRSFPESTRILDTATLIPVLLKIHSLPGGPCGKEISWAIAKLAPRSLPAELIEMVAYYATQDPDPHMELWKPTDGKVLLYGGDPEFAGLNSTRGAAAHTIAKLLFADKSRWPKVQDAVVSVASDSSLAVRAMAIECLTAALNIDRNWAVREFLKLTEGADEILGCHNTDWFLSYASYTHFVELRALLIRMLGATCDKTRKVAAARITVLALEEIAPESDLETVLRGDVVARAAAARVFADGLAHEPVRQKARGYLQTLFHDPEKKVRSEVDHCFRRVPPDRLHEEDDLIRSFIESETFADDASQLCFALKEATSPLPDIVCSVAEKLLSLHKRRYGNQEFDRFHSSGHYIAEIVVRLYQQTTDRTLKTRALDIIDEMLQAGIWRTDEELQKVGR